ncbi:ATP-dependent zinc metalloprotease FtsH [Euzebya pacifica]|uniref:ATP-dependent zinc metalloprotease FtsH n=1 Tax=Euzebya pacifica TaxID=1608957 RepID=UPI0030FC2ADC
MNVQRFLRGPLLWITLLLIVALAMVSTLGSSSAPEELTYGEFIQALQDGELSSVTILSGSNGLKGEFVEPQGESEATEYVATFNPIVNDEQLDAELQAAGIEPEQLDVDAQDQNLFVSLLINLIPFALIFLLFFFLMSQMQGGGGRVMSFGKAKAKQISKDQPKVTFEDVAGAQEAVEELREIKDFLANPTKFQAIGAKIPKGVLLFGPPGTGKTLLARAVAGEAGVPFFSISGSDFVEMFVGVGASRVRDLFEQAKSNAPAIIFVDEIDAVGRHRGAGMGGGHDEREQTLNQLLVEMDGFDVKTGVILIAATNRPDILDPALLRPGRFDRQIVVDRPDIVGREAILKVHARGKPLAPDADLTVLAKQTPGLTGADLQNLINEAALLSARRGVAEITMASLEDAIDRVLIGPERRTRLMHEDEKRLTAYHEGGHAIVGHALPHADPVHKVTIIPRGQALGVTISLPERDKYGHSRQELIDRMAMALGGRVAEQLTVGDYTTGAGNDIAKATEIARKMVTEWGMSEKLGPIQFGHAAGEPFLGRETNHPNYSAQVAAIIDEEIRTLIDEAYDEAVQILVENRQVLEEMADELMEHETLGKEELAAVLDRVTKRPSRSNRPLMNGEPTGLSPDQVVAALRRGDPVALNPSEQPEGAAHLVNPRSAIDDA